MYLYVLFSLMYKKFSVNFSCLFTKLQAREVFQQKSGDRNIKITMAKPNFQPIKDESKLEVRFLELDYTARKDVVQCYHCGTMLPRYVL